MVIAKVEEKEEMTVILKHLNPEVTHIISDHHTVTRTSYMVQLKHKGAKKCTP